MFSFCTCLRQSAPEPRPYSYRRTQGNWDVLIQGLLNKSKNMVTLLSTEVLAFATSVYVMDLNNQFQLL